MEDSSSRYRLAQLSSFAAAVEVGKWCFRLYRRTFRRLKRLSCHPGEMAVGLWEVAFGTAI